MFAILAFSLIVLTSWPDPGESAEVPIVSAIAERHRVNGRRESVNFLIENTAEKSSRRARLSITGNFLEKAGPIVHLGHYKTDRMAKLEDDRRLLLNWSQGLAAEGRQYSDEHPNAREGIHAYVGGFALDPYSPLRSDALTFLSKVWEKASWEPIDAVEIRKSPKKETLTLRYRGKRNYREVKTTKDLGCGADPADSQQIYCFIPGYGTAYLPK